MNKRGVIQLGMVIIIVIGIILLNNYLKENPISGSVVPIPIKTIEIYDQCEQLTLNVKVGTTIRWINKGTSTHILQLNEQVIILNEFQSFAIQFSKLGPHKFICDGKQGIIFVEQ